jgi:dihydroorotate dehydrogenase
LSDDLENLKNLILKFREISSRVVVVKVSPDSSNEQVLEVCEILSNISKTAINIGNTKYVKAEAVGLSSKSFSKEGGGLSGGSLYHNTLKTVKLISTNYNLPIIATGGVSSYENVKELLDNGALLTGMATLLVTDPFQIPLINYRLSNV